MKANNWPLRFALATAIVLYAVAFGQLVPALVLGFALLVTCLPFRFELDRIGDMIVGVSCMAGAYVLAVLIGPPPKHPIFPGVALLRAGFCVWLLLYSMIRLLVRAPWLSHKATTFLAFMAIFACGGSKLGWVYPVCVSSFTLFALWAIAKDDPARPSLAQATTRRKGLLVSGVIGALLVAIAISLSLPPLYAWTNQRIRMAILNSRRTGFNEYFRLGSLQNMIRSSTVALRVQGPPRGALRLRGIVYDRYFNKYWLTPQKSSFKLVRLPATKAPKVSWTVEYVSGNKKRYFVPLHSANLATPTKQVRIDRVGLVLPPREEDPNEIRFTLGNKVTLPVAKPGRDDLQLPRKYKAEFRKIAQAWTRGLRTPAQKLRALQRRLREGYRYSLSFKRPKGKEPILNFLRTNKQGHCEYFASALALLARGVGIPARVIGGFMVSEYSMLGGYYIVRQRNAHAWIEAWLPGKGWQTFDATPSAGLSTHMPPRTGSIAAFLDLIRVWATRARKRLAAMTLMEMLLSIGAFIALWFLIRLVRRFRRKETTEVASGPSYKDPMPAFSALLQALQEVLEKHDNEPVERYARRLRELQAPERIQHASQLLLDYAAYRYGHVGDPDTIAQRIHAWLGQTPPP